jgi:hypothetical protein
MATVLLVIFGLAILASFFVAYMSAKNWPIYQAVLVAFVFLGTVVFFYLGARTLATHRAWRNVVKNQQNELARIESQLLPLRGGLSPEGPAVPGEIPRLKQELALLTSVRGGAYFDVAADSPKDNVVQLTFKAPEHGLVPNTVLFAVDQKPFAEGGRYLGEFKVVAAPEGSPAVQIAPNLPLTEAQTKRLAAAIKGTWTLYTTMPPDKAEVFAPLDDAKRQALLPPEIAAEYARLDRALTDYRQFFHDHYVQRALLADAIAKTKTNIERTEEATKEAIAEGQYRETEKTNLAADLAKFQFEVQAIAAYKKSLEDLLADVRARLKATYIENRQAATALAKAQFQAAEQINQRAGALAPR